MLGMLNLHKLAAQPGEGLTPRLRELLERQAATQEPHGNVVPIAGNGGMKQAGPNPVRQRPKTLPQGVLPFPDRAKLR